jgi:hypothetical protein
MMVRSKCRRLLLFLLPLRASCNDADIEELLQAPKKKLPPAPAGVKKVRILLS